MASEPPEDPPSIEVSEDDTEEIPLTDKAVEPPPVEPVDPPLEPLVDPPAVEMEEPLPAWLKEAEKRLVSEDMSVDERIVQLEKTMRDLSEQMGILLRWKAAYATRRRGGLPFVSSPLAPAAEVPRSSSVPEMERSRLFSRMR